MRVDAWSEWAGTVPDAAGSPPVPAGPPELDDLHELIVTRAARLAGTSDALLWLADQAWRTGRPLATTGPGSLPDRPPEHGGPPGVGAALCVPLVAGGSVVGVVGVAWSEPGRWSAGPSPSCWAAKVSWPGS